MGVPAFFRWLTTKYPKTVTPAIEEQPVEHNGEELPVDISGKNPNGEETDNLYLDMNNIVHPCTHPEGRPAPETEEEMMVEIFRYIERLLSIARPRKVLMMAVDGVAPRAKMNQQRSRRFRSAMDVRAEEENKIEFHKKLIQSGKAEPGSKPSSDKKWDSNVITPGTPFMFKLSQALRYWVSYKLNTDPGWKNLKVIISDASVPGEGEHKMMEFIRSQRRSPEHDPNTRHVIYGLDADLIMLGLATHEPHFRILREDVFAKDNNRRMKCSICGQNGHMASECKGEVREIVGDFNEQEKPQKTPYVWLHISVLREYLELELKPSQPMSFKWDLERAIDDYVFLCFFVGNDFLPHLPSLEIREEGIDTLTQIWRDTIATMDGYISKDGYVDLERAQLILDGLGRREAGIFRKRREIELSREKKRKEREDQRQRGRNGPGYGNNSTDHESMGSKKRRTNDIADPVMLFAPGEANSRDVRDVTQQLYLQRQEIFQEQVNSANTANKSAAALIKEQLLKRKQPAPATETSESTKESAEATVDVASLETALGKRKAEIMEQAADEDESTETGTPGRTTPIPHGPISDVPVQPQDTIQLWEPGYEERYYEQKFHADPKDMAFRQKVAAAYVEGVQWVLLYYMQGCPAWQWYYPYHYAPFASNFRGLKNMKMDFEVGKPFKPYEQLMGVFPADSRHAIPEPFRSLMTDEDSPIIDFYPTEFAIDLNGKKFNWQGVAILPFVDEQRLLAAMATRYPQLAPDEVERNAQGQDILLFSHMHPMYEDVLMSLYSKKQGADTVELKPKSSQGLSGTVSKLESYMPNEPLEFPLGGVDLPGLSVDNSLSVHFEIPTSKHIHKSQLLRGLSMPEKKLDQYDIDLQRNRSRRGGRGGGRGGYNNTREGSHNDYYNRQGQNNHNGDRRSQYPPSNFENPFAAHLNPAMLAARGFPPPPQLVNGVPPPPPGWPMPAGNGAFPPPQFAQNGYNGGSTYNGNGSSYNGRQQQQQQQHQQYQQQGYGSQRNDRGGGYHGNNNYGGSQRYDRNNAYGRR